MPYLTAQEVRDRARSDPVSDPEVFSDEQIEDYIAEFEEIAEDYCGVAFITRTQTDETHECYRSDLLVLKPKIITVSALTLDDTALVADTDYYTPTTEDAAAGILRFVGTATGTVEITYTYGFGTLPATIKRACVQYVRAVALRDNSKTGRDVITDGYDGGATRYSTPDFEKDRPTGYIEVDRLLKTHRYRIPGVA